MASAPGAGALRPRRERLVAACEALLEPHPSGYGCLQDCAGGLVGGESIHAKRTWAELVAAHPLRVESAQEAWEVLATRGVIPVDWVGDAARRYAHATGAACPRCGAEHRLRRPSERGCSVCDGSDLVTCSLSEPPTLAAAVALAADAPGVLAAEALAREVAFRLSRFGAPTPARVVWRVAQARALDASWWASRAWTSRVASDGRATRMVALRTPGPVQRMQNHTPLRVDRDAWHAAPHAELLARGYALEEIADAALVLVAPELGA